MTNDMPTVFAKVDGHGYWFDCPACGKTHRRRCVQLPSVTGCNTIVANFRLRFPLDAAFPQPDPPPGGWPQDTYRP